MMYPLDVFVHDERMIGFGVTPVVSHVWTLSLRIHDEQGLRAWYCYEASSMMARGTIMVRDGMQYDVSREDIRAAIAAPRPAKARAVPFRDGPVPSLRGRARRNYFRHYYRAIHTTPERRAICAFDAIAEEAMMDHGVRIKGRRRVLPNTWDDIPRNSGADRSWKQFRRHQYRG